MQLFKADNTLPFNYLCQAVNEESRSLREEHTQKNSVYK